MVDAMRRVKTSLVDQEIKNKFELVLMERLTNALILRGRAQLRVRKLGQPCQIAKVTFVFIKYILQKVP